MADYAVVPGSVVAAAGARIRKGTLGETCVAGDSVYRTAGGTLYKADANVSAATAKAKGVLLNGGTIGQPAQYVDRGPIVLGVAVAAGAVIVQSATPGKLAPVADLATGWWVTVLAVGMGGQSAYVNPFASGYQVP